MKEQVFPTLYGLGSNGKIKVWEVSAQEGEGNTGVVRTVHGALDGKQQSTCKTVRPKNVGRANETTGFEQAVSDAQSAFNKKKDKQYYETMAELDSKPKLPLPMLAHQFEAREKDIVYPCYTQPKLNGLRCLAEKTDDNTIRYSSRGGKFFHTLKHLTRELLDAMNVGDIVDGELFSPHLSFEEITSIVRNEKEDKGRGLIEYHLYDSPSVKGGFGVRFKELRERVGSGKIFCKLVSTSLVVNKEEVLVNHGQYNAAGYEGTMLRNKEGEYEFKNRSKHLQKFKDFQDAEFEIIGGRDGEGKFEGLCIFTCRTSQDVPVDKSNPHSAFEVVPKGTTAKRREYFENLDNYIGKALTVRFQAYSAYGVPLFPVGISVREGAYIDGTFEPTY